MKKKIWKLSPVAAVLLFLPACQPKSNSNNAQNAETKKVYSSPKSTVSTEPNKITKPQGPIAFGTAVPTASNKDTVDVKLDVTNDLYQVTRGVYYEAWEFGGSVPGPTIKVKVGQTVRFSMTNRSNEPMKNVGMMMQGQQMKTGAKNDSLNMKSMPMPHSIDFHAAMVNPADKYRTINPGETITFYWTANYPGVFMYHCGTPMVLIHMIRGMIGMVIVEPKGGFPDKVDTSIVLVQNEFYLKKEGNIYVPDTAKAKLKQPTYVTFNGHPAQYVINPIHVKAGERVRIYFLNAGPNNATAFHIIGTIMDKVWMDGNPHNLTRGRQSVYIGPASGAIIDFVLPQKGTYSFIDHSFADAEMGAIGAFKAE